LKYITVEMLKLAKGQRVWDIGNQCLYDLCSKYPVHNNIGEIIAKLTLIGRAYAAAIERRKNAKLSNDDFLVEKVCPEIKRSALDKKLCQLKELNKITLDNIPIILQTHKYLVDIFYELTSQQKRSLASKYLHFHLSHLFYLYDSRAYSGFRKILPGYRSQILVNFDANMYEIEYGKFFCKLFELNTKIHNEFGYDLTPRQLDNVLLEINKPSYA